MKKNKVDKVMNEMYHSQPSENYKFDTANASVESENTVISGTATFKRSRFRVAPLVAGLAVIAMGVGFGVNNFYGKDGNMAATNVGTSEIAESMSEIATEPPVTEIEPIVRECAVDYMGCSRAELENAYSFISSDKVDFNVNDQLYWLELNLSTFGTGDILLGINLSMTGEEIISILESNGITDYDVCYYDDAETEIMSIQLDYEGTLVTICYPFDNNRYTENSVCFSKTSLRDDVFNTEYNESSSLIDYVGMDYDLVAEYVNLPIEWFKVNSDNVVYSITVTADEYNGNVFGTYTASTPIEDIVSYFDAILAESTDEYGLNLSYDTKVNDDGEVIGLVVQDSDYQIIYNEGTVTISLPKLETDSDVKEDVSSVEFDGIEIQVDVQDEDEELNVEIDSDGGAEAIEDVEETVTEENPMMEVEQN